MNKRYTYVDEMLLKATEINDSDKKAEYIKSVNEGLMRTIAKAVCESTFYPVDIKDYEFCKDFEPWSTLQKEIRYLYLFEKGNSTADNLTESKRNQLARQCLGRLSEGEAKIFAGILKQNLNARGISKVFLKKYFLD